MMPGLSAPGLGLRVFALTVGLMACSFGRGTEPTPLSIPDGPPLADGIWISRAELMARPMAGQAWMTVEAQARQPCPRPDLEDQESPANTCVLAKALVATRTANAILRGEVVSALKQLVEGPPYRGRALSLGRKLAAFVIAADVIDLRAVDPIFDGIFRGYISGLMTTGTHDGPTNLIQCHETRPNNWGTNCGASRAAVAAYLGDAAGLARVAEVFRGWTGDRTARTTFRFGDLVWQCDPAAPVGINPIGCVRDGHSIDGVLPDDQRRAGGFVWPPPRENYVYEALQGAVVQAVILQQAGQTAFAWGDQAILRAFRWLHAEANFPPGGDDTWLIPLINRFYAAGYPTSAGRPGKVMAWTDWTHGR